MSTIEQIQQAFGKLAGGRMLDVATGRAGWLRNVVDSVVGFEEVVGIDTYNWGAGVDIFDRENIHFIRMDARHLGFGKASFDTVSIGYSLHHMADFRQVLAEMMRVLRPGGRFVVGEMYRDGLTGPQLTHVRLHHWAAEIDRTRGETHNPTFARQELVEIVEGLCLGNLAIYDRVPDGGDPKGAEKIEHLDRVIDQMLERARALPDYEAHKTRGEEIREWLHEVGFQGASQIVAIGEK